MTGYNDAHGHTDAVLLNLDNDREALEHYTALITDTCSFDGQRWSGIDDAAAKLREYVISLKTAAGADNRFPEIAGATLADVSWVALVHGVLAEANVQAGRPGASGLT